MSDSYAEMRHDQAEYLRLCKQFGEEPRNRKDGYGDITLDTYGKHAEGLRARDRKDMEKSNDR